MRSGKNWFMIIWKYTPILDEVILQHHLVQILNWKAKSFRSAVFMGRNDNVSKIIKKINIPSSLVFQFKSSKVTIQRKKFQKNSDLVHTLLKFFKSFGFKKNWSGLGSARGLRLQDCAPGGNIFTNGIFDKNKCFLTTWSSSYLKNQRKFTKI